MMNRVSLEDTFAAALCPMSKEPCFGCRKDARRLVEELYVWMDSEGIHFERDPKGEPRACPRCEQRSQAFSSADRLRWSLRQELDRAQDEALVLRMHDAR